MTPKQAKQFNQMLAALKIINNGYQTTSQLRRNSEIETVFCRSQVLSGSEITAKIESILVNLKSDPIKEAEFITRLLLVLKDYQP